MNEMTRRPGKPGRLTLATILGGVAASTFSGVIGLLPSAGAQPESFSIDDRGFINTAARCEKPKFAVAIGRTDQSLVAICVDGRGHYEYHGMRLKDRSVLTVPAKPTADGKFIIENAGFTYTFSPKELAIAQGPRVIRTEAMVAYVEPRMASEAP
ncbi:hypothetical protein [Mycobacterium sp. MMS18-G62]